MSHKALIQLLPSCVSSLLYDCYESLAVEQSTVSDLSKLYLFAMHELCITSSKKGMSRILRSVAAVDETHSCIMQKTPCREG